ncbi:tetratricopeptide repeat protein [Wenjunlia tyrosinilytica]|uniref:HTH cro/C1-type domain-containing protein n=1 Tax=Wenjunlia tyrosinilytica TaxID=1544741 RepID=A0A917ZV29_9ACTN|nr:tetratricopeptide repeat protein [Wenjunlia tyrosinilytica]GGO94559.1 hypothetical protein GCM10012280_49750 [Wenjunlia tyrosinilytica]
MVAEGLHDPAALRALHDRLEAARVKQGLDKTQLANRSRLSRTTVSQAFSHSARTVPSADTLGALAAALELDVQPLLELRRAAIGPTASPAVPPGVGQPIAACDPLALEVHPAVDVPHQNHRRRPNSPRQPRPTAILPHYVPRLHDAILANLVETAADGHSQIAVLVGSSSTGKTRACWEAVQPLAGRGWQLWHPFDPTRAEAALADLDRVGPRTVVWLNEAQHYLGAGTGVGERIAAALHTLLTNSACGPVLVLGTLWPQYARNYTTMPHPGLPDPHSRVRELLDGHLITLPDHFDTDAIAAMQALADAGDEQLAHALEHARDARLTQFLAGAPHLLRRYHAATPAARAVLEAAMDARRLGASLHLPMAFLAHAAEDYLGDDDFDLLQDDWFDQALTELATPVHGNLAPLRRVRTRRTRRPMDASSTPDAARPTLYRLADFLEQHGQRTRRRLCPPASFWEAAHHHFTSPDDLAHLADSASNRYRNQWANPLWHKAAYAGNTTALLWLAWIREEAGDHEGAEAACQRAADAGNTDALLRLAQMRERAEDHEGAEAAYQRAADASSTSALLWLVRMRERAGDHEGAEAAYQRAADAGNTDALHRLARMREKAGDRDGAEALYQRAASVGDTSALLWVAQMRERAEDHEGAEAAYQRAADAGNTDALLRLAQMRERTGDHDGAERLARQAADAGHTYALYRLAEMREKAGDRDGAERLARQAANIGNTDALLRLAETREKDGDA